MSNVVNLEATVTRNYGKNTFIPKPFEHIFTCNAGELVPAYMTLQIQPGDIWKITTSIMARLNTSRYPTIARGWVVYNWFYVPHSQVWDGWDQLMGENKESAWKVQAAKSVPKLVIPENVTITNGHFLDHIGWPTEVADFEASDLKRRAYCWVCNEFYRNQTIEPPFAPNTDDASTTYSADGDWTVGGKLYQISRNADYFSTALPEPQKGPDILIPLGTMADIYGNTARQGDGNGAKGVPLLASTDKTTGSVQITTGGSSGTSGVEFYTGLQKIEGAYANLENADAADINTLREKIVTQHIYERDARSGGRIGEQLFARWGVEVDPLELGRPLHLTGGKFDISTNQIPQTSASQDDSYQGTLTAFGYTNNRSEQETFGFKQHGTLMCLVAIAYEHKYQQGIPREDMKFDRFDFWHPEFAGLGDQPIYDYEIYATGGPDGTMKTESIFGYAVRGAEYQNYPSIISGQVRSNYAQSLDYVHMADDYASKPTLTPEWMKENPDNLDRTIFVSSNLANQFVVDFVAEFEITTTMPLYSIPGIDRL